MRHESPAGKQALNILEQSVAAAPQSHVTVGLPTRLDREMQPSAPNSPRRNEAWSSRSCEDARRNALVVSASRGHTEPEEELAHRLAARAQLHCPVVHLLPRDAGNQFAEERFVWTSPSRGRCSLLPVDPACLYVRQPSITDEMAGQLSKALAPAIRQVTISGRAAPGKRPGLRGDLLPAVPSSRPRPASDCRSGARGWCLRAPAGTYPRFNVQSRWFGVHRNSAPLAKRSRTIGLTPLRIKAIGCVATTPSPPWSAVARCV